MMYFVIEGRKQSPPNCACQTQKKNNIKKWMMFFEQKFLPNCPIPIQKVRELRLKINQVSFTNVALIMVIPNCPFPIQKLKELWLSQHKPGFVYQRSTYNGAWESHSIYVKRKKKTPFRPLEKTSLKLGEFEILTTSYKHRLQLSKPKYDNLQILKEFYKKLPHH